MTTSGPKAGPSFPHDEIPWPKEPNRRIVSGQCAYCDEHKGSAYMPPHDPSPRCESGKRPHCTCDICF